jgi:hypothetical protein
MTKHLIHSTTDQPLQHSAVTVSSHDDQIAPMLGRRPDDFGVWLAGAMEKGIIGEVAVRHARLSLI